MPALVDPSIDLSMQIASPQKHTPAPCPPHDPGKDMQPCFSFFVTTGGLSTYC